MKPLTVAVTAKPMPDGTVELNWTLSEPVDVGSYEVHRSTAGSDFAPHTSTRVYRLPGIRTYLDTDAEPGSAPWYRIVAFDRAGAELAVSAGVRANLPAEPVDRQHTSVLSAFPVDGGVRLSWRAAAGAKTPLSVYSGPAHVADGKLGGARKAATSDGSRGAVTHRSQGHGSHHWSKDSAAAFALVDATGKVLATAVPARTEHPRLLPPQELGTVRRIIQEPGTPRETWRSLLARVAAGSGSARDAAFAYTVTGEQIYAQQAFALFQREARVLPNQVTLDVGNTIGSLAPAYDLAYQGWTLAQRAEARETLKHAIAYWGTAHAGNIDNDADKSSNWVAINRGGELLTALLARGDGDIGLQEQRIPVLLDELRRYLAESYGDSGWNQEGWDYTNYALTLARPAVEATQKAGIRALDQAWERPAIAHLALRTHSLRPTGDKLQFGVGERAGSPSPMLLDSGSPQVRSAYRWTYERTVGHLSTRIGSTVPGDPWTLINWPAAYPAKDPDSFPALREAILDDVEGAYYFRNRTQGDDDVLVGTTNRNRAHLGWNQPEALGLSLIGEGTTWARMPAKESSSMELFSKPLIDGKALPPGVTAGQGRTVASRSYAGQGGGYLSLDAHQDYGIDTATRDQLVDLRPVAKGTDAVIALHDHFADDTSHRVDWQMSPERGVAITYGQDESGTLTFLFRRDDAWLKGWLLHPADARMSTSNGAFRITRTGTSADFRIVLATGRGETPVAKADGHTLTLGSVSYDTDRLASFRPAWPAPAGDSPLPTAYLTEPQGPFTPGSSREVSAALTWWSQRPATDPRFTLVIPDGWSAQQVSPSATRRLRSGERAVLTWKVTAPEDATAGDHPLSVTAHTAGISVTASTRVSVVRANLALARPAEQSSTQGAASRATDGNVDGYWGHGSVSHTLAEYQPWWQTDLGASSDIGHIVLWNRVDCCAERLHDFYVLVSDQPFGTAGLDELLARGNVWRHKVDGKAGRTSTVPVGAAGRHVRIQLADPSPSGILALAEVQVLPPAEGHLAQGQPAEQSGTADGGAASHAVDGDPAGAPSRTLAQVQPWWQTDLGEVTAFRFVETWNTTDPDAGAPTDYYVLVSDVPFASDRLADVLAQPGVTAYRQTAAAAGPTTLRATRPGRYIRIQLADPLPAVLSLAEVKIIR